MGRKSYSRLFVALNCHVLMIFAADEPSLVNNVQKNMFKSNELKLFLTIYVIYLYV